MEEDFSLNGSLDDELAAAFDGEFGNDDDPLTIDERPRSASDHGEGGNSESNSDVDLDELADEGFNEIEALEKSTGQTKQRPPKRPRLVHFGGVEELGVGPGPPINAPSFRDGGGGSAVPSRPKPAPESCTHPVWVFGLCGVCGISKEAALEQGDQYGQYLSDAASERRQQQGGGGSGNNQDGVVRLKHLHASKELEVSTKEAERIRRDTVSRLLSRRRLILILDLDHTLLNSVHTGEVGEDAAPQLAEVLRREEEANLGPRRLLHRLADNKLWTKLRPGVFEFLEGLRDSYEMHIYTMGDKNYAAEVRRLLDPTGRLFSSVIAKDHSTTATAKHLDVLLSADELALVLDDTEMVWPGHRRNLLQIERYHYFPSDLRKWRADGTALLEQGRDESATNGALATHMRVLRAVHARFFSQDDPSLPPLEQRDVRVILAEQRARILQGCSITFSRCWPQDRNPRNEPLWQLAQGLGATCLSGYDPSVTTHIVAAAGGTEKVHLARSQGKAVVSPSWLHGCSFRWQRLPEEDFHLREPGQEGRGGGTGKGGGSGSNPGAGGVPAPRLSPEEELRVAMEVAGGGSGRGQAREGS